MSGTRPTGRLKEQRPSIIADVCEDLRQSRLPQVRILRELRGWEQWEDSVAERMEHLRFLEEVLLILMRGPERLPERLSSALDRPQAAASPA